MEKLCFLLLAMVGLTYAKDLVEVESLVMMGENNLQSAELSQGLRNINDNLGYLRNINDKLGNLQNINNNLGKLVNIFEKKENSGCPSGFVFLNERCYFFSNETAPEWIVAWRKCKEMNPRAALVSLETSEEWLMIEGYLQANAPHRNNWWTSATDSIQEGEWVWMGSGETMEFRKWGPTEPNGRTGENCMHLYGEKNLHWNDSSCKRGPPGNVTYFICELY